MLDDYLVTPCDSEARRVERELLEAFRWLSAKDRAATLRIVIALSDDARVALGAPATGELRLVG